MRAIQLISNSAKVRLRNKYFPLSPISDYVAVRNTNYGNLADILITPSGTYPGSTAFIGGVLLTNGNVFCVPYNSTTAAIYNPNTNTLSTPSGTYPGSGAFYGGVLLPNGNVFCVPYNSTTAAIYNPNTNTLSTPSGTYPGSGAFHGGVLLTNGNVFCVPCSSNTARIYGLPLASLPKGRTHSAFDNKF